MADFETELINGFIAANPRLDIWRRYPDITGEEDMLTDSWACHQVSEDFVQFATERGVPAWVVTVEQFPDAWVWQHSWIGLVLDGAVRAIDFTARQFYDVERVLVPALEQPWPLRWTVTEDSRFHPVLGIDLGVDAR